MFEELSQRLNPARISRRELMLLSGAGLASASRVFGFGGDKEFWENKDPATWSAEEIAKLLTKSPWAKSVSAERTKTQRDPMAGPSSGVRGSHSRSSSAGMPGGNGTTRITTEYKGTVVWESAAPIRSALKSSLPDAFAGQIVLGFTGVPLTHSDSRGAMERLRQITTLTQKGRQPLEPVHVEEVREDSTVVYLFGFAKDALDIDRDVKEVVFITRMGSLGFAAKFNPREMIYRGELAL
jgi:hypothetical protein